MAQNTDHTTQNNQIGKDLGNLHPQEIYRSIFELSSAALAIIEPDTSLSMINNAFCKLSGYEYDELIGTSWTNKIAPLELEKLLEFNARRLNGDTDIPIEYELTFYTKSGQTRYGLITSSYIEKGLKTIVSLTDITDRKKLEENLRFSEEKYRTLVEHANDIIYALSPEGTFIFASPNWTAQLGHAIEEVVGHSFAEFIPKSDIEYFADVLKQGYLSGEKISNVEYRVRHKDGSWRWYSSTGAPLADKTGQVTSIIGVAHDITERKKMELALKESEFFFKESQRAAFIGSYKINFNTGTWESSEVLDQILGIGKHPKKNTIDDWHNTFHPHDRKRMISYLTEEVLNKKQPFNAEYRIIRKNDNAVRWIHGLGIVEEDANEGSTTLIGTIQDITQRKEAEEELLKLTELQQFLMNMASKYINININEFVKSINQSLSELSEYVEADRAYIFEYDWDKQVVNNTHEWCRMGITPQIDQLQKIPFTTLLWWINEHKQGKTIIMPNDYDFPGIDRIRQMLETQEIKSLITIPMMDNDTCIGFIGFDSVWQQHIYSEKEKGLLTVFAQILVNYYTRSKLEANILEEKEKANAANHAKSEFLANMSHEIRTPMNSILGFSEVMLNTTNDPKHRSHLSTIMKSGKTLLSLINDILDLSKIEAGRMDVVQELTDIRPIITEIEQLFFEKAQSRQIKVRHHISKKFPQSILVDELRIRQILLNLVGNAMKFTENGKVSIDINLGNMTEELIDFEIAVTDTGIGIPIEDTQRIFESFSQQSGQDNRRFGGTGLGLAITKRLVEIMNGKIEVESAVGKGSRFSVFFTNIPYSHEKVIQTNQYLWDDQKINFKGQKILVVDDLAHNRDLVHAYLDEFELTIIEAENGEMAIEIANTAMPDLILMDIRMPGINGYEATQRIKSCAQTAKIPIVAFTASTMQSDIQKLSKIFDGYQQKPIQKRTLIAELTRHLAFESQKTKNYHDDSRSHFPNLHDTIPPDIKEQFIGKFASEIEEQRQFMMIDSIESLASKIQDFASEHQIRTLLLVAEELQAATQTYDYEVIVRCLASIQTAYITKEESK